MAARQQCDCLLVQQDAAVHSVHIITLQHTATHCNTLQHTATVQQEAAVATALGYIAGGNSHMLRSICIYRYIYIYVQMYIHITYRYACATAVGAEDSGIASATGYVPGRNSHIYVYICIH